MKKNLNAAPPRRADGQSWDGMGAARHGMWLPPMSWTSMSVALPAPGVAQSSWDWTPAAGFLGLDCRKHLITLIQFLDNVNTSYMKDFTSIGFGRALNTTYEILQYCALAGMERGRTYRGLK